MERYLSLGGLTVFFRVSLGSESLVNYYQTNFNLMQHHKYSLNEVENMMTWEREIYIILLLKHLEEEKKEQERQQQQRR